MCVCVCVFVCVCVWGVCLCLFIYLLLFQSGNEASVYILPGPGGTVYYEGEDLIQLIKVC